MCVEDLDLRPDDERAHIHGNGGTVRSVLLDDRGISPFSRSTWPGPGTPPARCYAPSINGRDRHPRLVAVSGHRPRTSQMRSPVG
jgi:integrase/recombinase XerD